MVNSSEDFPNTLHGRWKGLLRICKQRHCVSGQTDRVSASCYYSDINVLLEG